MFFFGHSIEFSLSYHILLYSCRYSVCFFVISFSLLTLLSTVISLPVLIPFFISLPWFSIPPFIILIICFPHIHLSISLTYRVIHKSLRNFRTRLRNNQDRHDRKEHIIGRESLKGFFVLGALAYLQVPPLGGSRGQKWRAQWIRKRSVSWNLPKLSQLWRCNGGFGPCTAQNHLRTKQFVSSTWNSSRVAACALRNEEAGRGHRPRLSSVCEKRLLGALRNQHIEHL